MIRKLIALILCALPFYFSFAQNFRVFYHDLPAAIAAAGYQHAVPSAEPGFSRVPVFGPNVNIFINTAPPNLRGLVNRISAPNSPLMAAIRRVAGISNGHVTTIEFHFINDVAGLTTNVMFCNAGGMAWQCATNRDTLGGIFVGEQAAGAVDIDEQIIHEVFHTQTINLAGRRNHRYHGTADVVRIKYGGDVGHFLDELQGDQQAPMEEGLASYQASLSVPHPHEKTVDRFYFNDPYFLGSHSLLTGVPQMWNARHTVLIDTVFRVAPVPPIRFFKDPFGITLASTPAAGSRYSARLYQYCNIPGEFVFNSELFPELYLHLFRLYGFADTAAASREILDFFQYFTQHSEFARHRYPYHMAMFLAGQMERFNMRSRSGGTKLVSSFFALGLFDMLTRFDMTDDELKRLFTITTYQIDNLPKIPQSLAFQKYFNVRASLKQGVLPALYGGKDCAVQSNPIEIDAAVKALRRLCESEHLINMSTR